MVNTFRKKCSKCGGMDLNDYTYACRGRERNKIRKTFRVIICNTCGKEMFVDKINR